MATERTRLLVDAGLSFKETCKRLVSIGEDPERLDAILITHEHTDHVCGLPRLAKRLKIPIYMTWLTAPSIEWPPNFQGSPSNSEESRLSVRSSRATLTY